MTVYVEYHPTNTTNRTVGLAGRDIVWSRLWADDVAEGRDFAGRLGVEWSPVEDHALVSETRRRRAILMGAIPVHTAPHHPSAGGELSGVAA